jgi:hypothetical protein
VTDATAALPEDVAAFIQGGVSITVASRDERFVPSIAKAVGCRVGDDGTTVTVLMFAEAATRGKARYSSPNSAIETQPSRFRCTCSGARADPSGGSHGSTP